MVGDGRVEGSSAVGDGGRDAVSLIPEVDGIGYQMHVCIFEKFET